MISSLQFVLSQGVLMADHSSLCGNVHRSRLFHRHRAEALAATVALCPRLLQTFGRRSLVYSFVSGVRESIEKISDPTEKNRLLTRCEHLVLRGLADLDYVRDRDVAKLTAGIIASSSSRSFSGCFIQGLCMGQREHSDPVDAFMSDERVCWHIGNVFNFFD